MQLYKINPQSRGKTEGVTISGLDLSGRDLHGTRVRLYGTLRNCKFDNANLEGADFSGTLLRNCSFRGANLRYAKLYFMKDCDVTDTVLGGFAHGLTAAQMRSTWNFKNKDFSNIYFAHCDFPDVEYDSSFNFRNSWIFGGALDLRNNIMIDGVNWEQLPRVGWYTSTNEYVTWEGTHAFRTQEFRRKSLHGLTIAGKDFHDCDFSGFTFGFFQHCDFTNANFKDARRIIYLSSGADSKPVPAGKFGFQLCNVTKEQIAQTRFWKEGDLRGIILEDMNLDGWDFSNKDLSYASLKGSSVRGANFENASFYYTDLTVAKMTDTGLLREELPTKQSNEPQSWTSSLTVEKLKQSKSWKEKNIDFCTFDGVNFDNADLSGLRFNYTKLLGCSFHNTNLNEAYIDFRNGYVVVPKGLTEKQVRSLRGFTEEWLLPEQ